MSQLWLQLSLTSWLTAAWPKAHGVSSIVLLPTQAVLLAHDLLRFYVHGRGRAVGGAEGGDAPGQKVSSKSRLAGSFAIAALPCGASESDFQLLAGLRLDLFSPADSTRWVCVRSSVVPELANDVGTQLGVLWQQRLRSGRRSVAVARPVLAPDIVD